MASSDWLNVRGWTESLVGWSMDQLMISYLLRYRFRFSSLVRWFLKTIVWLWIIFIGIAGFNPL